MDTEMLVMSVSGVDTYDEISDELDNYLKMGVQVGDSLAVELEPVVKFFNNRGFKVVSTVYSKNPFSCTLTFAGDISLERVYKFLDLPKKGAYSEKVCTSMDDSWFIFLNNDNRVVLSLSESMHLGVLAFILSRR